MPNRAEILKQNFQNSVALLFDPVLSEGVIQKVLDEQGVHYRQTLYTPIVVVWAWISQVLDADQSLSNAVKRVVAWLAVAGESIPSVDTGAYSKARKRLPLSVLPSLLRQTATALQGAVPPVSDDNYFLRSRQLYVEPIEAFDKRLSICSSCREARL